MRATNPHIAFPVLHRYLCRTECKAKPLRSREGIYFGSGACCLLSGNVAELREEEVRKAYLGA